MTGAGGGIGAEACRRLRLAGFEPFVTDVDPEAARLIADEVGSSWCALDVTSMESWSDVHRLLGNDGVALGGLILNAGIAGGGGLAEFDRDRYRALFAVNVDGVVNAMATFLEDLKKSRGATIVVTASLAGLTGAPFDPIYAMTKHAVIGLVRSCASTLEREGVTLQAVCPGLVDTPLLGLAKAQLDNAEYPLLTAAEIADVLVDCTRGTRTDPVTVVQVGRPPMSYRFAGVPGPGSISVTLPRNLSIGRPE